MKSFPVFALEFIKLEIIYIKSVKRFVPLFSSHDPQEILDDPKSEIIDDESGKQTVSKESQQEGKVTTAIYIAYMKSVKSSFFVCFVALLFITAQALQGAVDYFISIW